MLHAEANVSWWFDSEVPLVQCRGPVVLRRSGHHKKWANVSIIAGGEGLCSAATQLNSIETALGYHLTAFCWYTPSFLACREGNKERESEGERYLDLGQVQLFPLYICSAPLPGSRHRFPIPNHTRHRRSKWLRRAKFLTRCVETKQQLNLEIRRE